jgi:VCBS repeat-containing protein
MAIIIGNNSNNTINGTSGSDLILGNGGNDIINAGAGHDWVFAGSGNDIVNGGDGNDVLFGETGNDTLNGGRGSDYVFGNSGNDTLIFNAADVGGFDIYDGGCGIDRIVFELTAAQWANVAIKADILTLLTRISSGNTYPFVLSSLNLCVSDIEAFQVKVGGVIINPFAPTNTVPVAVNDAFSIDENGLLGAGSSVIGNDNTGTGGFTVTLVGGPAQGLLTLNANGAFTFDPGTAYDYLAQGQSANAAFTYKVTNSAGVSNTATVNITVTGTNDVPTVSGTFVGAVVEDDNDAATISGSIAVTDADAGQSGVVAAVLDGTYGTLNLQANGTWVYQLDNSRTATQALNGGLVVTESFGVTAIDGTALDAIEITVNGTNDAATLEFLIDDESPLAVYERGDSIITGRATIIDVDAGEAGLLAAIQMEGIYGVLDIDEYGAVTYTLDQTSAATQALRSGDVVTDEFIFHSLDGTELAPIVIEVYGANDRPPRILGLNGFVSYLDAADVESRRAVITDRDPPANTFISDTIVGTWGTLTIENDGDWTYARNNTAFDFVDADFIAGGGLNQQTFIESFVALTIDSREFYINISAVNDSLL